MGAVRSLAGAALDTSIKMSGPPIRNVGWFLAAFYGNQVLGVITRRWRRLTQPLYTAPKGQ